LEFVEACDHGETFYKGGSSAARLLEKSTESREAWHQGGEKVAVEVEGECDLCP
jgi:hypothetical protein